MPKAIHKKGVQKLSRGALPYNMDIEQLHAIERDISGRIALYRRIARSFNKKYNCNLEEFEGKIKSGEVAEHPCWEEAIEWGNALDELERLKTVKQALKWTANSLG
ncbi:MAG TPA: hypothetical protein ACFYD6_03755 [Candidatus Brocadiia bacterium]|nr:hypothetical protein [Candidatus Brocadiales bacterium]